MPPVDLRRYIPFFGDLANGNTVVGTMTPGFEKYIKDSAVLTPEAQVWKLFMTGALVVFGQVIATSGVFALLALWLSKMNDSLYRVELHAVSSLNAPISLIGVLLTFSGFIFGVTLGMRVLHGRWLGPLISPTGGFSIPKFLVATLLFGGLGLGAFVISLPFVRYLPNLTFAQWQAWLLPALLATFVQVFAEELLFRGYLQRMLAARFVSPLIWIGIPTVIFGLFHLPTALAFGENFWLVLLAPTLLGGFAAHVTARTGSLAGATGLHFANNCLGLLLVSVPGPFGMLSLYTYSFDPSDVDAVRPMILINLSVIALAYAIYLFATRRKA